LAPPPLSWIYGVFLMNGMYAVPELFIDVFNKSEITKNSMKN
jgi:hypothetical protein